MRQTRDGEDDDVQAFAERMLGHLDEAWARGWQPADLVRLYARRVDRSSVDLLRGLVGCRLASYPSGTLDRRWRAQLHELGVGTPGASLEVLSSAREALRSRIGGILQALEIFLRCLPRLEQLTPLPGRASAHDDDVSSVDERVLSRVRALLAKAESTTYPAEAETFTAGAQALMSRHSISAAMLAAAKPEGGHDGPGGVRIGLDPPYESPKAALLAAVADANRCRSVWSKELGFCTVVGFAPDLQAVEAVYTSLLVQATTALQHAGHDARSRSRSFRRSFLLAFATRMHERLVASADEQTGEAVAELGERTLLPVLADRALKVDEALDEMFPSLRRQRRSGRVDPAGWARGWVAAEHAVMGPGLQVRAESA